MANWRPICAALLCRGLSFLLEGVRRQIQLSGPAAPRYRLVARGGCQDAVAVRRDGGGAGPHPGLRGVSAMGADRLESDVSITSREIGQLTQLFLHHLLSLFSLLSCTSVGSHSTQASP
jgi:hypothetical protein